VNPGRRPLAPVADPAELYRQAEVALLTMHEKQRVIAPALEMALGCHIRHVTGYDTDRLGTFTRDIARLGTQLDTARHKARIGMELSGLPLGLGSEGSFGPDPFLGALPWNLELILFIDDLRGLEVVGVAQGKANFAQSLLGEWTALDSFARSQGFPRQQLVVRPDSEDDPRMIKGIDSWSALEAAFAWALRTSASKLISVETDGRAHTNPERMANIGRAAQDLAARLAALCPACGAPGFWSIERLGGLPCRACGAPTNETRAHIHGCVKCDYRETHVASDREFSDPTYCDYCNP
jgi:hypothetical protein